jgi:hypothetical protein
MATLKLVEPGFRGLVVNTETLFDFGLCLRHDPGRPLKAPGAGFGSSRASEAAPSAGWGSLRVADG